MKERDINMESSNANVFFTQHASEILSHNNQLDLFAEVFIDSFFKKINEASKTELQILNIDEVCELLRCSRPTVQKLINRGLIPCVKVGTSYKFSKKSIEEWFTSLEGLELDI